MYRKSCRKASWGNEKSPVADWFRWGDFHPQLPVASATFFVWVCDNLPT
jgi:hypothetical protein